MKIFQNEMMSLLWLIIVGLPVSAFATDTYVKVTSASDLVVGGTYILAAQDGGTTYVATGLSSYQLNTTSSGFTVSPSGDRIERGAASFREYVLGGSSSAFTLQYNSKCLGNEDGSTNLVMNTEVSNLGKWTFSSTTYALYNKSATSRFIGMRTSDHIFRAYQTSGTYPIAYLYKKVDEVPETPTYTISWSVNGVIADTEELDEGSAVTFNPAEVPAGTDKVFVGWVTSTTVDPDEEPSFVTSATATADITYYAVFADADITTTGSLTKLTSADFSDGDKIVVVAKGTNIGLYQENFRDHYVNHFTFTNKLSAVDNDSKKWWILTDGGGGKWKLGDSTNGFLYNQNSDSNMLDVNTENSTNWTISWSSGDNAFSIAANRPLTCHTEASTIYKDMYKLTNSGEGTLIFDIYKYVPTVAVYSDYTTTPELTETITLAEACTDGTKYYGTYSSGHAFVVPSDLTVSEIKVSDGKLTVGNYTTGNVVPANTGVMVSSTTSGAHSVVISGESGTSVFNSNNMLQPSGSGITAAEMAENYTDCKYYRLTMHNGTTLGYYWGAAEGAAFALAANKAFLAVPTAVGARLTGFDMADSEVTAVESLKEPLTDSAAYNLYGQRVDKTAKGIIIRNGKKQFNR